MKYPEQYLYTKEHEWMNKTGNTATIGITDHAQSSLGDIVFVELPKIGRQLKKGEVFGVVESVKAVSELYSPISGKVTAINESLNSDSGILNRNPHDSGWLIKVELTNETETSTLMKSDAYLKFVQSL